MESDTNERQQRSLVQDLCELKKTPAYKGLNSCNLKRECENTKVTSCRIHDLRIAPGHAGIGLFTISQLLGHNDIKMTQRPARRGGQAHLAPNHKKIAVNMLNLTEGKKTREPTKVEAEFSAN